MKVIPALGNNLSSQYFSEIRGKYTNFSPTIGKTFHTQPTKLLEARNPINPTFQCGVAECVEENACLQHATTNPARDVYATSYPCFLRESSSSGLYLKAKMNVTATMKA